MSFAEVDEEQLIKSFNSYSLEALKNFVAHALTERVMLIISLSAHDGRNVQREVMLGVLARLQKAASDEIKRR